MKSKFYVENLGCAKNQVDAEVMIASLKHQGWTYAPENPEAADLIIVNTCGFIKSAQEEACEHPTPDPGRISGQTDHRRRLPGSAVVEGITETHSELDGVFGNRAPHLVNEAVDGVMAGKKPVFTPEGGTEVRNVKISSGLTDPCT